MAPVSKVLIAGAGITGLTAISVEAFRQLAEPC
jgi:hypothetical protein